MVVVIAIVFRHVLALGANLGSLITSWYFLHFQINLDRFWLDIISFWLIVGVGGVIPAGVSSLPAFLVDWHPVLGLEAHLVVALGIFFVLDVYWSRNSLIEHLKGGLVVLFGLGRRHCDGCSQVNL